MTEPTATLGSQGQRQRHRRLEMFERGRDDGRCTTTCGSQQDCIEHRLGMMKQENINLGIMIFLGMLSLWLGYVGLCCNLDEFKVYCVYSIFRLFGFHRLLQIDPARSCSMTFRVAVGKGWSWEGSGLGSGHISRQQLMRVQLYPTLTHPYAFDQLSNIHVGHIGKKKVD